MLAKDGENFVSRSTCGFAGYRLPEIVELLEDNDMRVSDGETEKCIYKIDVMSISICCLNGKKYSALRFANKVVRCLFHCENLTFRSFLFLYATAGELFAANNFAVWYDKFFADSFSRQTDIANRDRPNRLIDRMQRLRENLLLACGKPLRSTNRGRLRTRSL